MVNIIQDQVEHFNYILRIIFYKFKNPSLWPFDVLI